MSYTSRIIKELVLIETKEMKSFNIHYQIYSKIVSTLFALLSQMKIESCFSSSTGLILFNRMRNRM